MININDIFDSPREFKGLKIYPIRMKDYLQFNTALQCLLLDKNSIPDPEIISMTYLEYLYSIMVKENFYFLALDFLLKLCLKLPMGKEDIHLIKYDYDEKNKPYFEINENRFLSNDFDELKKIICEQNLVELPDENVSREAREAFKKASDYKQKESGRKMAGLEDQIVCVLISTSLTLEDISNLTIRKFIKILERLDLKLHYQIYLSAQMSGMVTFKDTSFIKHWLSDTSGADQYADGKVELQEVKDKIK